jgi:hypothetical protein
MASKIDDGRVWGRPEALDTLGRVPGRRGRTAGGALGMAAIAVGAYLALNGPAIGQERPPLPPVAASPTPTAGARPSAIPEACTGIVVNLPASRVPAEGIPPASVIRLSRVDPGGSALLVPQAFVLRVADGPDGGLRLSVLVRGGSTVDTAGRDMVEQVNGANADGSLVAARLYEVDSKPLIDECKGDK